jgi:hypothetical protein
MASVRKFRYRPAIGQGLEMADNLDEPALSFAGVTLSEKKETVRIFYSELWDRVDKSLMPTIFHPDFTFRGSLGRTLVGYEQFADYGDWVTGALGHITRATSS